MRSSVGVLVGASPLPVLGTLMGRRSLSLGHIPSTALTCVASADSGKALSALGLSASNPNLVGS